MVAYMEMVNAQLRLLNKQFIVILNGNFNTIYVIYQWTMSKTFPAKFTQTIFFLNCFKKAVNKQKKGYILI